MEMITGGRCRRSAVGAPGFIRTAAVALLAAAVFSAYGTMEAAAQDSRPFIVNVWQEEEGNLELLLAPPGDGSVEELSVTLSGAAADSDAGTDGESEDAGERTELVTRIIGSAAEAGLPRTIYCLVDISGSMKEMADDTRELLYALADGLGEGDSLVIGKMESNITDTALMSDPEEISSEIEGLSFKGQYTDLYGGVIHGIEYLGQAGGSDSAGLNILVVVSDGIHTQDNDLSLEDALDAVAGADVTVYTAALIPSGGDSGKVESLKSIAEKSAGGKHFPDTDGGPAVSASGGEAGSGILSALDDMVLAGASLPASADTGDEEYLLTAVLTGASGTEYEDSFRIESGGLKFAAAEDADESGAGETDENTAAEENMAGRPGTPPWGGWGGPGVRDWEPGAEAGGEEAEGSSMVPLAAGGILLIIIIIAAAVVISRNKKKKQEASSRMADPGSVSYEGAGQGAPGTELTGQELAEQESDEEMELRAQMEELSGRPRLPVTMTVIGVSGGNRGAGQSMTVQLIKDYETSFGRTAKANVVLNPGDNNLSGVHFVMHWDGSRVHVWDAASMNGTAVNGVVISELGKVAIESGDTLWAGSCEYRLYWEG